MSVIQFQISKTVAQAIDIADVASRARAIGIAGARLEYNDSKGSHGSLLGNLRITCSRPVVAFLCDEIVALAGRSSGELVIECATSAKGILDVLAVPPPTMPGLN